MSLNAIKISIKISLETIRDSALLVLKVLDPPSKLLHRLIQLDMQLNAYVKRVCKKSTQSSWVTL